MAFSTLCWLLPLLPSLVTAIAEPTAVAEILAISEPIITPAARKPSRAYNRRNIISDAVSGAQSVGDDIGGDFTSLASKASSALESYYSQINFTGEPGVLQNFPTGDSVASSLGIQSSELAALPTQCLNLPQYSNWTDSGWSIRFHGNIYKQPNTSESDLNRLADGFLVGTSIDQLNASEAAQARNVTAEIFVVQQGNVGPPIFSLAPAPSAGGSGEDGGGGATTAPGGNQTVTFPYNTTAEGDFDAFVPIQLNGLNPGNTTTQTQRLNVYTQGAESGNATAYLYPTVGLTVISDIDDILRVTKIWQPGAGLIDNTFAYPFTSWMNMPDIYADWSANLVYQSSPVNFHYLTTTPEQITRNYMQFIFANYPGGSFDTRPLNISNIPETASVRKYLLDKIFQTFPQRKFILVADTSNPDVMRDYPQMVTDFPNQVQCIFLRNTSSTDSSDDFPYETSGFKNLNQSMYMFFNVPDDLTNLDIANGGCYNSSVKQNVTFSLQGLPLGLSKQVNAGAVNKLAMLWMSVVLVTAYWFVL